MAQAGEAPPPLRIGFVGSGFIAKFHAKSFQSVRHAQITGVFSPTAAHRDSLAAAINAVTSTSRNARLEGARERAS